MCSHAVGWSVSPAPLIIWVWLDGATHLFRFRRCVSPHGETVLERHDRGDQKPSK
jgi:hypothetical protein